jgi:hypothetical protein
MRNKPPRYDQAVIYPHEIESTIKTWKRAHRTMHLDPNNYQFYPTLAEYESFALEGRRAPQWRVSLPGSPLFLSSEAAYPAPHAALIDYENALRHDQARLQQMPLPPKRTIQRIALGSNWYWWWIDEGSLKPVEQPRPKRVGMTKYERRMLLAQGDAVCFRIYRGRCYACFPSIPPQTSGNKADTSLVGFIHAVGMVDYINDPNGAQLVNYSYDTRLFSKAATAAEFSELKRLLEKAGMHLRVMRKMHHKLKWWSKEKAN